MTEPMFKSKSTLRTFKSGMLMLGLTTGTLDENSFYIYGMKYYGYVITMMKAYGTRERRSK
jgi:hypothetical protein